MRPGPDSEKASGRPSRAPSSVSALSEWIFLREFSLAAFLDTQQAIQLGLNQLGFLLGRADVEEAILPGPVSRAAGKLCSTDGSGSWLARAMKSCVLASSVSPSTLLATWCGPRRPWRASGLASYHDQTDGRRSPRSSWMGRQQLLLPFLAHQSSQQIRPGHGFQTWA